MGQRIATVSDKREVQIWDATTGEPSVKPDARALNGHIFNLHFSPDGLTIALATGRGGWVLDSATGEIVSHPASTNAVRHIAYSPDGRRVVTASQQGVARIWDTFTGSAISAELRHDDLVYWAEYSRNGHMIATASRDKTVRLWSADTGVLLGKPLVHVDSLGINHSVQFSPDGKWIATAAGKAAQIWNLDTAAASALRLEHGSRVTSVRFSPDGKRLVTATAADDAQVWDVATGHALSEPFRDRSSCYYAEFSPDGQFAVTASADGAARIWWVPQVPTHSPEWLPDLAEALVGRQMDETGSSIVVGVGKLFDVVQTLEAAASNTADFYSEWAKWFLSQDRH